MTTQSIIVTGAPLATLKAHAESLAAPGDRLLWIDEHPSKTGTSSGIYIEDVRELQVAVRAAPSRGRIVVVFADAATMTHQAQNALLKLLEEPHEQLQLILCTQHPSHLLDTVRSRCRVVFAAKPGMETVQLPADRAARIQFMAHGDTEEARKLATNTKYFDSRTALFEQAKRFVGSRTYERVAIITKVATSRTAALEFIDACLVIYHTLLKTRYSDTMRQEVERLLATYSDLQHNTNAKLQLLNFVVQ